MIQMILLSIFLGFFCNSKTSAFQKIPSLAARTSLHISSSSSKLFSSTDEESFVIRDFAMMEQLENIVKIAARPLPERPDGLVVVAQYTSATRRECVQYSGDYERLARNNLDTVFLRCLEEYEGAATTFGQARVSSLLPTFDVFYKGDRVARVEGPEFEKVDNLIKMYGRINSQLDLFSEEAENKRRLAWGEGKLNPDYSATPRTTARFIPGYDWDKEEGFFDATANAMQDQFDFENWLPPIDDDDINREQNKNKRK